MSTFREVQLDQLQLNAFQDLGKRWMLVNVKRGEKVNALTASWGGFGIMWNQPVAYVFLRPQRYTREMLDEVDTFSLTFFEESYRNQLVFCGANSGRDVDKPAHCGFDVLLEGDTPYYEQAHTALFCRKLYRQPMDAGCVVDKTINEAHYPQQDHHILYVGGIEKILVK